MAMSTSVKVAGGPCLPSVAISGFISQAFHEPAAVEHLRCVIRANDQSFDDVHSGLIHA